MANQFADDPGAMARAALEAFKKQRENTDKRIESLLTVNLENLNRKGQDLAADARVQAEGAILGAESNRELAMAVIAATEILDSSVRDLDDRLTKLNNHLAESSEKADVHAKQLARYNIVLAVLTGALVTAAFAQAWFTWAAAPTQVMIVPSSPLK